MLWQLWAENGVGEVCTGRAQGGARLSAPALAEQRALAVQSEEGPTSRVVRTRPCGPLVAWGGEESHVGAGAPRSKRAAAALVFSPRGHCGLLRFGMERYVCGWRRTLSAHIHRGGSPRELREAVGPLVMEAAFAAHSHYGLYCCEQRLSCFECVCMCGEDSRNRRAPTLRGGLPRGLAQATVAPLAVRASRCRRAATTVSIR